MQKEQSTHQTSHHTSHTTKASNPQTIHPKDQEDYHEESHKDRLWKSKIESQLVSSSSEQDNDSPKINKCKHLPKPENIFHVFPQLLVEVRTIIWKLFVTRRVITVVGCGIYKYRWHSFVVDPIPPLLACHESRSLLLNDYKHFQGNDKNYGRVLVDFSLDVLYVDQPDGVISYNGWAYNDRALTNTITSAMVGVNGMSTMAATCYLPRARKTLPSLVEILVLSKGLKPVVKKGHPVYKSDHLKIISFEEHEVKDILAPAGSLQGKNNEANSRLDHF